MSDGCSAVITGRNEEGRWRDGRSAPRTAYEAGIAAGLDSDYDPFEGDDDDRRRRRGGSRGADVAATNTLFVRVRLCLALAAT